MKTKKPILRLAVLAALSFFAGNEVVAQTNIGSACGCLAVGSRTAGNVQQYAAQLNKWSALPSSAYGGEITGNITLTCDKIWTIDQKIYVASGATLTIEPGTVIKGAVAGSTAAATALIIERGGKIMAAGSEACPIVFTAAADPLDGSYPVQNKGMWGGVLICGKATNNLTLAANGPFIPGQSGKLAAADGVGVLEGFASSIPQDQFGASIASAPTGYALGTSPSGNFTFTGTPGSAQNASGTTSLVVTTAPSVALTGQDITGTGITSGTTVTSSTTTTLTLSGGSTANLSGSYVVSTSSTATTGGASGATTLTLDAANSKIFIGMVVSGTGIATGTTVTGVSSTNITLSAASTAAMSGTYTFSSTFTGADVLNTTGTTKIKLTAPSFTIAPGLTVSGTGIANGTTVVAVTVSSGTVQSLTLSTATTATPGTLTFGGTYPSGGTNAYFPICAVSASATGSNASTTLTLSASNSAISAGMAVSGTGIASGTTISSISGTTITLSAASTAAMSGTYTFSSTNASAPAGLAANGTTYVNYSGQAISATQQSFDDNDNSGVMTYVSIRHSGANLLVGSEINGLTLASVGRGTKIEHIEIVSCADDNIEIFGGTVNLKYCTTLFGNDDMFDYDLGWSGKAQFLFGMKANQFSTTGGTTASGISNDSDNGFEADSDDNQSYNSPKSTPVIYNATLIGNEKVVGNSDNSGLAAIMAKEYTGGELYNSLFANFRSGFNMKQSIGTGRNFTQGSLLYNQQGDAYHNWTNSSTSGNGSQILKVKCNTFVGNVNGLTVNAASANAGTAITAGTDFTQFTTTDNNIVVSTLTGFDASYLMNGSTNVTTTKNDVVPSPSTNVQLGTGCAQAPIDGFFEPANYRGAFKPSANNENWLSDWTFSQVLNSTKGVVACPTDINNDGTTDVNDFLIFSGQFGQACN
jgi:hypothetical protein